MENISLGRGVTKTVDQSLDNQIRHILWRMDQRSKDIRESGIGNDKDL